MLAEVRALNERLVAAERKAQNAELRVTASTVAAKHAEKLPFSAAYGPGAVDTAIAHLEQYVNETGEMPGATIEDSLRMSLEAVESNLEAQAKVWEGLLTKARKPATVGTQVAAPKPAAQSAKTLTTGLTAPGTRREDNRPKTEADYRREALAVLEAQSRGA